MKIFIWCKIMVALSYDGTTITPIDSYGKLVEEQDTVYIGDFSDDVKRLPLIGDPKNYSAVKVPKEKCTKHFEK